MPLDAAEKTFCDWCTAWKTNWNEGGPASGAVGYLDAELLRAARAREELEAEYHGSVASLDSDAVGADYRDGEASDLGRDELFNNVASSAQHKDSPGSSDREEESDLEDEYDTVPSRQLRDVLDASSYCALCRELRVQFQIWADKNDAECDTSLSTVGMTGEYVPRLSPELLYRPQCSSGTAGGETDVDGELYFLDYRVEPRNSDNQIHLAASYPSVKLQKSLEVAPTVSDIFAYEDSRRDVDGINPALAWPDHEPYVARRRPLVADMRLFQKWRKLCDATHGKICRPWLMPKDGQRVIPMIRLIDVETASLVEINEVWSTSWVALSYVWGAKPFRTLTLSTLEELKHSGALNASWVPSTIADAISVTKGLGERYLWTDSLCTIQDSDADKMMFVPNMDIIYGRASVTIVSAAGEDAFSGLPGVRPNTRFEDKKPFQLDGTWFMQSLSPPGAGGEVLSHSKWNTRGWTFQEAILSQRWLIFTEEQVFWECRQATWREDACWELPNWYERNQAVMYKPALSDYLPRALWQPSTKQFDESYQYLVHSYTQRALTRETDGLNAFSGVLRAMTQVWGLDFFWGLPVKFMGVALTWPTCRDPVKRRSELCLSETVDGATVTSELPSWSWVGWTGRVYFQEVFGYVDGEHAGLKYWRISEVGGAIDFQALPLNDAARLWYERKNDPFPGADPRWRGDTSAPLKVADVPPELLGPSLRHRVLAFWTSHAKLTLQYDKDDTKEDSIGRQLHSIWVESRRLDVKWDQYPALQDDVLDGNHGVYRSTWDCIVVGRDSVERFGGRGQLDVLLVARHPSGGWCRVGQVVIREKDWNGLERRWEVVYLI